LISQAQAVAADRERQTYAARCSALSRESTIKEAASFALVRFTMSDNRPSGYRMRHIAVFCARDVAASVAVSRESMAFKPGHSGNPSPVLALISHLTIEQKLRCSFSRRRAVQQF
jgi:hypothetical protein